MPKKFNSGSIQDAFYLKTIQLQTASQQHTKNRTNKAVNGEDEIKKREEKEERKRI